MPSSKNYKRDYKQENKYKAQPEQIKARVERNAARREALKEGIVKKGDNKQVDHKVPLSKGGSNAKDNLRVVHRSKNESFARNSDGSLKSQTSKKERKGK
jgi:5-methylcytosine-specific restriction endonuclease McrA